ncbi:MAG: CBS domain-containing protein [Candidatus Aenigmatarchaeota archaeon]
MLIDLISRNIISAEPEEKISVVLGKIKKYKIHQLPVIEKGKFIGMIFLNDIVTKSMNIETTKVKAIMRTNIPTIDINSSYLDAVKTIIDSGVRALPVFDKESIVGIIAETDLIQLVKENPAIKDVMTTPICISKDDKIGRVRYLMREKNISRLPIVDNEGKLVGAIDTLDLANIMKPKEKQTRAKESVSEKLTDHELSVGLILRKTFSVNKEARLHEIIPILKEYEEVIITDNEKPVGIITPKDVIELLLPKKEKYYIQIANIREIDASIRPKMYEIIENFLEKERRFTEIDFVFLYVDTYKKRGRVKYSLRARVRTNYGLLIAKTSGWDVLTCIYDIVKKLEREIRKKTNKSLMHRRMTKI